jgi:hypothetical protein
MTPGDPRAERPSYGSHEEAFQRRFESLSVPRCHRCGQYTYERCIGCYRDPYVNGPEGRHSWFFYNASFRPICTDCQEKSQGLCVFCVRKARDQRRLMRANNRRRLVLSEWTQVDLQDPSRWPDGLQCLHTCDRGYVHFHSEDASRTVLPLAHGVTPFAPEFVDAPRYQGNGGNRDDNSSEGPSSYLSDSGSDSSEESGERVRRGYQHAPNPPPSHRRRRSSSPHRPAQRRRRA